MHTLIIGMTESGKTTLAKILCKELKKRKKKTAVLDPLLDPDWQCDFITSNQDEFLQYARTNQSVYCFIDEGSETIGRYNKSMQWFATQSRHWGHSCFFISQGCTQLPPIVRAQCSRAFCFAVGERDTQIIAEEWREKSLYNLERVSQGEFFVVDRFSLLRKGKVDFTAQTLYYDIESGKASDSVSENQPVSATNPAIDRVPKSD